MVCLFSFILVTGGGIFYLGTRRISAFSCSNGLYALILLGFLRFFIANKISFLLIPALEPSRIAEKISKAASNFSQWLNKIDHKTAVRSIWIIVCISLCIKLANSFFYYGFLIGDDLEIHEMTFAKIFNWNWEAWYLRNAFYPMVFVYLCKLYCILLDLMIQEF